MKPQLSALELVWFAMEKVHERHPPGCNHFLRIIAVRMEKVSIIARRDLHLGPRDRKLLDPELLQHSWQYSPDSIRG